jgi:hypothetical protein
MKKSRGGRIIVAKKRATNADGGKGPVKNRPAGRRIMKILKIEALISFFVM